MAVHKRLSALKSSVGLQRTFAVRAAAAAAAEALVHPQQEATVSCSREWGCCVWVFLMREIVF